MKSKSLISFYFLEQAENKMEHVGNDTARVYVKYLRCDKTHLSKHNCIIRTNNINLVLDAHHVFMFFHGVYENSMRPLLWIRWNPITSIQTVSLVTLVTFLWMILFSIIC